MVPLKHFLKIGSASTEGQDLYRILNEIDAKRYLLSVTERYKIPLAEQEMTAKQLEGYLKDLDDYLAANT